MGSDLKKTTSHALTEFVDTAATAVENKELSYF